MNHKTRVEKLEKRPGAADPMRLFITYDKETYTSQGETFTRAEYEKITKPNDVTLIVNYDEDQIEKEK